MSGSMAYPFYFSIFDFLSSVFQHAAGRVTFFLLDIFSSTKDEPKRSKISKHFSSIHLVHSTTWD